MGILGAVPHGMPFGIGLQELFGRGGSSEFPSQSGTGNPKREPGLKNHGKKNQNKFQSVSSLEPQTSINPKSCKSNPLETKDSPKSHPSRFFLASPLPFSQNPNPRGVCSWIPAAGSPQQEFLGAAGQAWIRSQGSSLVSNPLLEDFPAFPADFCPVDSPGPAQDVQLGPSMGGNPARGRFGRRGSQIPEWGCKKKKNQGEPGDRDGDREGDTGGAGTPWSCVCDGDSLGTLEGTRVGQREVTDPPF